MTNSDLNKEAIHFDRLLAIWFVESLSQKAAVDGKRQEIIVLDSKRSNAINIGLTVLPHPRTIKTAILNFDEYALNKEGIEVIIFQRLLSKWLHSGSGYCSAVCSSKRCFFYNVTYSANLNGLICFQKEWFNSSGWDDPKFGQTIWFSDWSQAQRWLKLLLHIFCSFYKP